MTLSARRWKCRYSLVHESVCVLCVCSVTYIWYSLITILYRHDRSVNLYILIVPGYTGWYPCKSVIHIMVERFSNLSGV